jgi:hypothetical protein
MLKEQRRGEKNRVTESKEEAKEKQEKEEREDPKLRGKQFQRRNPRNVVFTKKKQRNV